MKRFVHQISRHPRKNVIHNICLKKTDIKQIDYCQHMQRYACVDEESDPFERETAFRVSWLC